VEAEAGAVGVLAPRGASRRGRISDPRGAPDRERIAGGSALQQHGGSGRGARVGRRRRDLQGVVRKGGGGRICSASEAGGDGGMGRGDWIGRSRGLGW
jgi:hypothetical protein